MYLATARLLCEVAPVVMADNVFALKGGTAINLFLRDMPRLSVDLDLVFPDHRPARTEALATINESLRAAKLRLTELGFDVDAVAARDMGETKLLVRRDGFLIKVEVNTVLRGVVNATQIASLSDAASNALMADLELMLVSPEDVYGGKLVAAMDRQHPRDLFDVMQLFEHEGITSGIRRAFVVYLASHNRPFHEVLFSTPLDIRLEYERTFVGMTTESVTLDTLLDTRARLQRELPEALDREEREFLRTLARAEPDWSLLGIPHLEELPAVRWKLQNLQHLATSNKKKFDEMVSALDERLQQLP